jgi:uncharacterized integral membrane protein
MQNQKQIVQNQPKMWIEREEGDYIIMKKVKLAFLLILSLVLVLLVAQNTAPVQARFLWLTSEIPVIVLLFLTSAGGFVAGLLVALLLNKDHQSKQ